MRSDLIGIAVSGGESSRMGSDKGRLVYHKLEQRLHTYHLLEPFCREVYISCTAPQADTIPVHYKVIRDEAPYRGIGPMAALLNAWRLFPHAGFLVLGCDYPLVEKKHMEKLLAKRNADHDAICYEREGFREPLIAVYETSLQEKVQAEFLSGNYSLRKILENIPCRILAGGDFLQSADTPEQREKMLQRIKKPEHE